MAIIPPKGAKYFGKKKKNKQRRQASGAQSGSPCVWELTSIKKTQACKRGGQSKSKESGQRTRSGSPPSHGSVSLENNKRERSQSNRVTIGDLHP